MKKIVVINHKTYLTLNEAKNYGIDINDYIRGDQEVIICPSNIYIPYFTGKYNFSPVIPGTTSEQDGKSDN